MIVDINITIINTSLLLLFTVLFTGGKPFGDGRSQVSGGASTGLDGARVGACHDQRCARCGVSGGMKVGIFGSNPAKLG